MIKLYWERDERNFGDMLSPLICQLLSDEKIEYCHNFSRCDLVAIGSILQHIQFENYSGAIWGSGYISHEMDQRRFPKAHICAVRGKLTRQILGCCKEVALGDPGLLCSLFAKPRPKRYRLGIIPHYVDARNSLIQQVSRGADDISVIDITADVHEVINHVAECEMIVASCLHGLIVADSLGIPNGWIKLSDKITGGTFKFRDYYSAFGIENIDPMPFDGADTIDSIRERLTGYSRPGIEDIKQQLIASFPFNKHRPSFWVLRRKLSRAVEGLANTATYRMKKVKTWLK